MRSGVLAGGSMDVGDSRIAVNTEFRTLQGELEEIESDLLMVPYPQLAQAVDDSVGLDLKYRVGLGHQVAALLTSSGICSDRDLPDSAEGIALFDTHGRIAASHVMLVGTMPLMQLAYDDFFDLPRRALRKLSAERLTVQHVTTTVHRMFGLDAGETAQNLAIGFLKGLKEIDGTGMQVTFVERDPRVLRTIAAALDFLGFRVPASPAAMPPHSDAPRPRLGDKPHIFVAMPFAEEFQDVYEFGIYAPVRRCGYICEKVDEASFTGDILHRIKEKIESAEMVIADLTGSRPNVYLEVGYAWGHGIPVVFVSKEGEPLHFDVQTHRCIHYKTIGQLARDLERFLRQMS